MYILRSWVIYGSSSFMRYIIDVSMPPNFKRHL
jgi:hypothetical protein